MTDVVRVVSDHAPALRVLLEAASSAGVEAEVCTVRARLVGTTLLLVRARGAEAAAPWLTALARHAPDAQAIVLLPARVGTAPSGRQIAAVVRDGRHVLRTLVDVCRLALRRRRPDVPTSELRPAPTRSSGVLRAVVSGLSHEVANPAAAISTNLEILRADVERLAELPPGGRASSLRATVPDWRLAIEESLEACRRVVGLVRQVNGLAREEPDPTPCELDPALAMAVQLLGRAFRPRGRLAARCEAPGVRVALGASRVLRLVGDLVMRVAQALAEIDAPPVRLVVATRGVGARVELALELPVAPGVALDALLPAAALTEILLDAPRDASISRDTQAVRLSWPVALDLPP